MATNVQIAQTPRRSLLRRLRPSYAHFFVLPYLVLLLAFGIGPALYAGLTSFSDPFSTNFSFTGLANYQLVYNDFRTAPAFQHVLEFMLIALPLGVVGVLLLSLLLHARVGRFSAVMRLTYYIPGAVAGPASVLIWIFMFEPLLSPFSPILHLFGFQTQSDVLAPNNLPAAFAVMTFFGGAGFWIVVVFGALMAIPEEIFEAAIMDGCNSIQLALFVKTPLIARYLVFLVILSFAGNFQIFVEPQLLNAATQGVGVGTTWSPNQLAYDYAFGQTGNFGASAAVSVLLLLVGLIVALVIIFKTNFYRIDVSERG